MPILTEQQTERPPEGTRSQRRRLFLVVAAVAAAGVLGSLCEGFNADELQHLHAAWMVGHGLVPYRDYFDHHPPLYHYLFAPLARRLSGDPLALLLGARLIATAVTGALLWLFWRLAPERAGGTIAAPGTLLLIVSRPSEILFLLRPDAPAVLLVLLAAWMASRRRGRAAWRAAGAGLCVGAAMLLTQKVLALTPAFVLWQALGALHRRGAERREAVAGMAAFLCALALPPLVLVIGLARAGGLAGFLAWPLGLGASQAVPRGWVRYAQEPVLLGFPAVALGGAWALASSWRWLREGREVWEGDGLLGLLALCGTAGYLATPAPTAQAYLVTMHVWLLACAVRLAAAGLAPPGRFAMGVTERWTTGLACAGALLMLKPYNAAAAAAFWGLAALAWRRGRPRAERGGRQAEWAFLALGVAGMAAFAATNVDRARQRVIAPQIATMRALNRLAPAGTRVLTTWPVLTPARPHATFHWFSDVWMYRDFHEALRAEYLSALDRPDTALVVCDPGIVGPRLPDVWRRIERDFRELPLPPQGLGGARAYVRRDLPLAPVAR